MFAFFSSTNAKDPNKARNTVTQAPARATPVKLVGDARGFLAKKKSDLFSPNSLLSFATKCQLVWNFRKYSGLDIGLSVGGKNKSRSAYCVRNVKGNELAKPAPIFAQIRLMTN